jgi:hypothetical protein
MVVTATRIRSFAPQLLVDDLEGAIRFYSEGPRFLIWSDVAWILCHWRAGRLCSPLKCAPKSVEDRANRRQHEHLDVYASVIGVETLYDACKAKGATILKPLDRTPWATIDFYLEDPEGYIIAFGETESSN